MCFVLYVDWATCVNGLLMPVCWLSHVKNVLQMYDLATGAKLTTFPLDVGSVVGFSGRKKDQEIFFQFTSFLTPGAVRVMLCLRDFYVTVALNPPKRQAFAQRLRKEPSMSL